MSIVALGGTPIIGAAVAAALLLVFLLFRAEDRFEAEDREAQRHAYADDPAPDRRTRTAGPSGAPGRRAGDASEH